MRRYLFFLTQKIGLDKSIAYSSGSRVINAIAGVVSVFFITSFLTGIEQGFYYTFGSVLALQIFFELGLTGIMTQYVAHESSHLILNPDNHFSGDEKYKSRLASLIHFVVKWYGILAVVALAFLLVVGFVFFEKFGSEHENVIWKTPWVLICFGTAANLFLSPFNSIFMGLGKVKEISKIGFFQQILLPFISWSGLALGCKLYILGIGYIISVVFWLLFIWRLGLAHIIINLCRYKVKERVSYWKEIFPFQWKIALSWVSGYFIFQLFNPVLFATEGAVVAGQMGMTLQALNAIQAFSMSWLSTKVPLFSKLIAIKDYVKLDSIFLRVVKQMSSVCLALLLSFFVVIWGLHVTKLQFGENLLADRFLPYLPLLLMMFPIYLQQFTNAWATYLRCHLKEPFLIISICGGIANGLSTIVLGNLYGLYGMTMGYCLLSILFFPWGYWIYKNNKIEWHG